MAQCKAKSKRSGERCQRAAMHGREVCYMHGGKSPRGIAAGRFAHGRRSAYMPTRYHEAFAAARADLHLLDLTDDLAQIEARIAELHQRLDSGETGAAWRTLQADWRSMLAAQAANDFTRAAELQAEIGRVLGGQGDEAGWREIMELIERRRRLVETETRRALQTQESMRSDEVKFLMIQIGLVVREHVHDRRALTAIATAISDYTGQLSG